MLTRSHCRLFVTMVCMPLPMMFAAGSSLAGVPERLGDARAAAYSMGDYAAHGSYLGDSKSEPSKRREPAKGFEKSTATEDSGVKPPASARVRFLPQKDGVWSVAETANFRIFFRGDVKPIDKMAQVLEESRQSAYEKWFGKAEDTWSPKCYLYLDDAGKEFKKAPKNARGYTSSYQKGWNYHRYITVHADDPDLVDTVLPHEVTHAVLIGHFVDQIPTWADEGMAGLAQRKADLVDFHKLLEKHERKGKLFSLQTLVELDGYPDDDVDLFYAQSAAVVEFLTSTKEPKVFVAFVRDGKKDGWLPALKKHYGYANFDEFEKRWKEHVFSKERNVPKGFTELTPKGQFSFFFRSFS
jgi:hypothetical protein